MLESAVDLVATARRVDIYGMGASALAGQDLHHKLHRIGLVSFMWSDGHLAVTSAAVLQAGDVAIAISHTGSTVDTVDALRVARRRGAATIAVTNFERSPLAATGDVVLTTAARETTFRSGTMASRIVQLALVDYLYAGVALRSYRQTLESLERTNAELATRHGLPTGH